MAFFVGLVSLSVVFTRVIHVVVSVLHSFLWLNDSPLYGYTMFDLSIRQWIVMWIVSTLWLL